ncbi:transcriptional regulator [Streptomyces lunaelactis]|uniref:Transcriptional regulator n=1 Tax=Streptomyces lunaelactis TaxID=1535768 RepID=A0A2R4TB40_9ACTN|nr:helix-turn-helix transcriptional regulator [Streptomyces lunaelactis]AVZ76345.1 transcriptional regulator [Streptomyces lunaelactis]NUK85301.1 helix-turn-helix domain-containing protein [Streptomyces lunaelactis]
MEFTGPVEDNDDAAELFRVIGRQLRLLRERTGLTQRELGEQLGYSEDLIRSLERGRRTPQPDFLAAADELLDAGGLLRAATEDVGRAKARARVRHPAWFQDYARLETQAVEISFFSTLTVPGLLQTEPYARTTFAVRQPLLDERTIEERVAARLDRQEILTAWPAPVVTVVLDESVLRREIGGPAVQREQLKRLLVSSQFRSTTIQILPMDCEGYAGVDGPFILLTPKGKPQLGYSEVQGVANLVTDPEEVRMLAVRYGTIRGQALTPRESMALIEKLLGDR